MTNKLTIFSVGNGDTILLECDEMTFLTDLNYRISSDDDNENESLEFISIIEDACASNMLDVFILTHPDQDHLRGFDKVFHTGAPDKWDSDGEKLLVSEIWCTPYALEANKDTFESKSLLKEIKRRHNLANNEKNIDGNKLKVLEDGSNVITASKNITPSILAPCKDEYTIGDDGLSNKTSLVIQWKIKIDNAEYKILLGGDAPSSVWERLYQDKDASELEWDILVAPHHCSRYTLGEKNEDGEFEYSSDTLKALTYTTDNPYIVASSKPLENNNDDPPSYEAKEKYIEHMLGNDSSRFYCTGGNELIAPGHISVEFTKAGADIIKGISNALVIKSFNENTVNQTSGEEFFNLLSINTIKVPSEILSKIPTNFSYIQKHQNLISNKSSSIKICIEAEEVDKNSQNKIRSLESGDIVLPNKGILFTLKTKNGMPLLNSEWYIKWQVVNTCKEAAVRNQLRGGFSDSNECNNERYEETAYCGIHWIQAFLFRKRDNKCCGQSDRFFVPIAPSGWHL